MEPLTPSERWNAIEIADQTGQYREIVRHALAALMVDHHLTIDQINAAFDEAIRDVLEPAENPANYPESRTETR